MTALNQTTLRGILARVLSVNSDYIVPKQGNWWNPQEAGSTKPHNWCAYGIRHQPRTAPFYHKDEGSNAAVAEILSTIDLQFVGPDSEDLAQSVALWNLRSDVEAEFKSCRGAVLNEPHEAIPSNFYQDGLNTVTAWNIQVRVLWYKVIETTQNQMTINTGGTVNVR